MPTLAMPDLPDDLEPIMDALGLNRVAVAILISLARHGGHATTSELTDELELPKGTISRALRQLAQAGLVTPDRPTSRGGRVITWTLHHDALTRQLTDLIHATDPTRH
ncbi:MarR family transcriptional regulator [Enemella dayhoffiae]|uniref:MarR family transcriptional regulator n=1 Tax=Enemella dayhoffiae TaxID=2016507 RepID=UPI0015951ACB|nr:MarR family transcriptional regulator [Enemella dayhoffiae]